MLHVYTNLPDNSVMSKDAILYPERIIYRTNMLDYAITVSNRIEKDTLWIATDSETLILALRVCVKRGFIKYNDIQFEHFHNGQWENIKVDGDGRFTTDLPSGFCDTDIQLLMELL